MPFKIHKHGFIQWASIFKIKITENAKKADVYFWKHNIKSRLE